MIDDFTPIVHRLRGRPVKVWAVADVHIGARECDLDGFGAFLKRVENDPDSYLVIVGDVLNNGTRDSLTNVYEETMPPSQQIDVAAGLLEPVKDRILGAVGGNHEYRSVKAVDLDPLFQVFTMLRIPEAYRQNFAFLRVILERGSTKDHYALYLTHGKTANKQRKFAQAAVEGVDAVICGHTHNGSVEKSARMVFSQRNGISIKPLISLTATSWLQYGGYAARGQLIPSATGDPQALLLDFTGSNNKDGGISVIW
ncbi:MAG: metallophosphoesterase [Kiritimatiellae bacterium]|nr:metallophosphoesterase [Kiritimatiellia bacterium]